MQECWPEEPLPCGEVGALEEGVFQDALHPAQGLDHVCAVVVQVPQLAVMTLVCPPEWVLLQHLDTRNILLYINNSDIKGYNM